VGGYRVDFAAVHPEDPGRMVLAIEADGASYRESGSVRDRDRLRGEHLQRLGWRYHRLWSTSWFQNPDAEIAKLQAAYEEAVADVRPAPPRERPAAGAAGEPAAGEPGARKPGAGETAAGEPGAGSHAGGSPARAAAGGSPLDAHGDGPEPGQPQTVAGASGSRAITASPGRARALSSAASPPAVGGSAVAEIEPPRPGKEVFTVSAPRPETNPGYDSRAHVQS